MTRTAGRTSIRTMMLLLALAGCSRPQGSSSNGAAGGGTSGGVGRTNPAFEALTSDKFKDEEFIAAISVLESANGATDASADIATAERRVLGIRQQGGWTQLPGISVAREKLPDTVRVVRIQGIIEGTSNPHAMRYQMLAVKYAKDYNGTMIRAVM
jgi:hypothetical protein